MNYEWVIGTYTGEIAKYVQGLADSGIGYYKMDETSMGKTKEVAVAFRRAINGPRPEHLVEIRDRFKIEKLEKHFADRVGTKQGLVK